MSGAQTAARLHLEEAWPYLIPLLDHPRSTQRKAARSALTAIRTYRELKAQVNRAAGCLRDLGVGVGDRVGIYFLKSIESAIALYAVMQAGAVYVPLDSGAPVQRTMAVLQQCGARVQGGEMMNPLKNTRATLAACIVGAFAVAPAATAADIVIAQGAGFDDPAPVAPVATRMLERPVSRPVLFRSTSTRASRRSLRPRGGA